MQEVRRYGRGRVAARVTNGRLRGPLERDHSGPSVACVFLAVIDRETGAHRGGGFDERHGENHRAFELLLGRGTYRSPAAANHVLDKVAHGGEFRGFAFDRLGFAHDDDGAVVDGVAGCRGGADDAVEQRHVEAEGRPTRERYHQATLRGTGEKEIVANAHVVCWDYNGQPLRNQAHLP